MFPMGEVAGVDRSAGHPFGTPTEAEIQRWEALDREQQLVQARAVLQAARDSGVSDSTMDDVRERALRELKANNGQS